jgi:predicted phage terminase large subunit-like protein
VAVADGSLTQELAARELLRRRRARASLVGYSQAITIPGAPVSEDADEWLFRPIETSVARHHVVTMDAIERCIRADFGRLMIFEPPGSAKSTYASVVATTWAMGAFPGARVLMTSYAGTPIIRHAKRARQIVASAEYQSLWERSAALVEGSKAADEWELSNGSGMYAAGLLGGLTSSRCDIGIIDDPVAGREEADSETIRHKTRAAYEDDFLTRLKPKASVILIQTRWHEDDLAGSILPEKYDGRSGPVECRDGQVWEILNIPAMAERADDPVGRAVGEYLWPEWFSSAHWSIYRKNARTWSALYQQRPVPDTGGQFERGWFKWYEPDDLPARLHHYGASDYAVTEQKGDNDPDFTEHGVTGVDENGELWLRDWWSGREATDVTIDAKLTLAHQWHTLAWYGEKGVIEKAIEPETRRQMRDRAKQGRHAWAVMEYLPTIGDKVARVASFRARAKAGCVHLPRGKQWAIDLVDQLCAFPAGRFDDKVDVCGLFGRALDKMADAQPAPAEKAPPPEPFTDAWFAARDQRDAKTDAERQRYYR